VGLGWKFKEVFTNYLRECIISIRRAKAGKKKKKIEMCFCLHHSFEIGAA
jgi:hypothetical protein